MSDTRPAGDVNERFAAERAAHLPTAVDQRTAIARRIAEGTLPPPDARQYRVNGGRHGPLRHGHRPGAVGARYDVLQSGARHAVVIQLGLTAAGQAA
jgi:hypothetical protein